MIKDLRGKNVKIAIKTKPSDCKEEDLHLLLSNYLYKELKKESIDVKRNNVNLIVSLKNDTELIVDCLDGRIYMDDKSIGKLRRFNMKRSGEAYDCAVQNAKRLINKIKSLQNELNQDNVIFKTSSIKKYIKDLRNITSHFKKQNNNIIDMRKKYTIKESSINKITRKIFIQDIRTNTNITRLDFRII